MNRGQKKTTGVTKNVVEKWKNQNVLLNNMKIVWSLILGIAVIAVASCNSSPKKEQARSRITKVKSVFQTYSIGGWDFFWGADVPLGLPVEAFVFFYAERDGAIVAIQSP